MRRVEIRGCGAVPVIGQGTWMMGEDPKRRAMEVNALQLGLDLGMTLIDTAEMYGDGRAEEIVADAVAGRRDEVFIVSKVLPENASGAGTIAAADRSLARLRTDRIDLYLLHWEGPHPLGDTLAAFELLKRQGKVRAYGVSNFDADALARAMPLPGGNDLVADQVLYNLTRRWPEGRLLPQCREAGVTVMAYSPLEQGKMKRSRALAEVGKRHGVTAAQVALAWTVRSDGVVSIPKATEPAHVRENAAAAAITLGGEDLALLERDFPPARRGAPMETL